MCGLRGCAALARHDGVDIGDCLPLPVTPALHSSPRVLARQTRAIVHEAIKASLSGASKKLGEVTIAFKAAKDEAEKFVGKLLGGDDDGGGEGTSDANGAGVGAGGSLADASPQVQRFGQYVNRVVPEINEHIKYGIDIPVLLGNVEGVFMGGGRAVVCNGLSSEWSLRVSQRSW